MFVSKPFPFMPARKPPYDQGSEARQHLGDLDGIQAAIVVIRPKATARYNEKGELILPSAAKAITQNDQPTIASLGVAAPNTISTEPATNEPQCDGAVDEGMTPEDELVAVASSFQSLPDRATATQDSPAFKRADAEVGPDRVAVEIEQVPPVPVVESGNTAALNPMAIAPSADQVEPDTAALAFKQHLPDGESDALDDDDGPFKHTGTKLAATRELWLLRAVQSLDKLVFSPAGHTVPLVKVTVGFPSTKPLSKVNRAIGQCWPRAASADGVNQIFINPTLTSPMQFVEVLAHELVHAVDDCKSGHKHTFQAICKAIGLTKGRPADASAGPELLPTIKQICADLGPFPHAALSPDSNQKVQTTRLLKIECPLCNWTGRTTAKWAAVGLPTCHCGAKLVPTLRREPAIEEQHGQRDTASAQPSLL